MTGQLPFQTILFDIDGTLLDSNGAHARAWTQALREHGIAANVSEVRRLIGMGADKLLPAVAFVSDDSRLGKAVAARQKEIFDGLLPSLQSTAGARPLVEYLADQRMTLAIATSADDRAIAALLERAGVNDFFPKRASKEDAAQTKPDPDIVRAALMRAGGRPESALLVGDTPYDVEAAQRAGIVAIALRCGGYWADEDLLGALAIFDDPAALLAHWRDQGRHSTSAAL